MSKEYCCPTSRTIISASTRYFGEATATIHADGERGAWRSSRVSKIVVEFKSGLLSKTQLDFPKQALEDLGFVYPNRWEFRDEEGMGGDKHLYLVGVAPHERSEDDWVDKTFHFSIENGVLKGLSFDIPTVGGGSIGDGFDYE